MRTRRHLALLTGLAMTAFTAIATVLPAAAADDTVLAVIGVRVQPGQLDAYRAEVGKLQAAMDRLGTASNFAMWQATASGEATGTVFVAMQYANLAAWADATAKQAADAEFQKLIGGLADIRTIVSSSLYRNVYGGGGSDPGQVLQTVAVSIEPGRLGDYVAELEKLQAIQTRVGGGGTMRAWQATSAGTNTGNVVIGIIHKDLASFAASTTKTQADAEWQKLIAGLDGMRTVVSTGLANRVDP